MSVYIVHIYLLTNVFIFLFPQWLRPHDAYSPAIVETSDKLLTGVQVSTAIVVDCHCRCEHRQLFFLYTGQVGLQAIIGKDFTPKKTRSVL